MFGITRRSPKSDPNGGFFFPYLTPIKVSYILAFFVLMRSIFVLPAFEVNVAMYIKGF